MSHKYLLTRCRAPLQQGRTPPERGRPHRAGGGPAARLTAPLCKAAAARVREGEDGGEGGRRRMRRASNCILQMHTFLSVRVFAYLRVHVCVCVFAYLRVRICMFAYLRICNRRAERWWAACLKLLCSCRVLWCGAVIGVYGAVQL